MKYNIEQFRTALLTDKVNNLWTRLTEDEWRDVLTIATRHLLEVEERGGFKLEEAYAEGYDAGYEDGKTEGWEYGYDAGRDDGYTDGYSEGRSDGIEDGV